MTDHGGLSSWSGIEVGALDLADRIVAQSAFAVGLFRPSRTPFTIIKAQQPYVDAAASGVVTFPSPAPTGSHLRFDAWGGNVQVSLDNGGTWQPAGVQPALKSSPTGGGFWQSYWHPVPAGTSQVRLKAEGGWWGSNWMVRDISIWGASAPSTDAPARLSPASNPAAGPEPADWPGLRTTASTD